MIREMKGLCEKGFVQNAFSQSRQDCYSAQIVMTFELNDDG